MKQQKKFVKPKLIIHVLSSKAGKNILFATVTDTCYCTNASGYGSSGCPANVYQS